MRPTHAAEARRLPAAWAAAARKSVRITLAVGAGFYFCRYGLGRPVMAVYALFGAVALGALSRVAGPGRVRAATVVRALPVGLLLTALGTLLAARTWAAAVGMLVVAFALTYVGSVAGPRAAGPAPGLQLCYILACFPPFAPGQLGDRLAGLTLGMLMLAGADRWLSGREDTGGRGGYGRRLAVAAEVAARLADRLADGDVAEPGEGGEGAAAPGRGRAEEADDAAEGLRPDLLPADERPASPSRADRAQAHAGASARTLLHQLARPAPAVVRGAAADPLAAKLLRQVATACRETADALRTGRVSGPDTLDGAIRRYQDDRRASRAGTADPRVRAAVLALAESARNVQVAVRVAQAGRPAGPVEPRALFWYAGTSTPRLWARRFAGHLTPRSVLLQNAVRVAVGLAAARLVAGAFDLAHGFWVLLAVLTLLRTTALQTFRTVAQAVFGTLAGALVAAALLTGLGPATVGYAAVLPPLMLVTFALGPLLGIAWAQGLFTVLVSVVFAQLAPATWQLDEVRALDVLTGSAVGLLCGLLAWPKGARHELGNAAARLLRESAALVGTVTGLLLAGRAEAREDDAEARGVGERGRAAAHAAELAQRAYAQYLTEPAARGGDADPVDWHAVLMTGQHALNGGYWLPLYDAPRPAALADEDRAHVTGQAAALARTLTAEAAVAAGSAGRDGVPVPPHRARLVRPVPELVDLQQWLTVLDHDAELLRAPPPARPERAADGHFGLVPDRPRDR
ncbi:FUSC family protein [Streptomyces solincola]|uniref:FUSC family protein n=1 Tax=Streptomyces solincola TaxID=2100817 RepID=UPI0021594995|nr:FUSC family protein [Streptomyces solincola]